MSGGLFKKVFNSTKKVVMGKITFRIISSVHVYFCIISIYTTRHIKGCASTLKDVNMRLHSTVLEPLLTSLTSVKMAFFFQLPVYGNPLLRKKLEVYPMKKKQGNRGYLRKIHVTRQFFEASGPQGIFFQKKPFSDKVYGSMFTKFQVCIVFRLARRHRIDQHIYK